MAHVAMVTHGTGGDVLPFIRLARTLRARGHTVALLTHAPYAAEARRAGARFIPIDTTESYQRFLATTPELLDLRGPQAIRAFYERCGLFEQTLTECRLLAKQNRPGETVLVGRYTSTASVLIMSEALGAPAVWVALCPTQRLTARVAVLNYRHGLSEGLAAVRASIGLPPITNWDAWFASARAELGFWPEWYDAAGIRVPARTRLTGFILPDADDRRALPAEVAELVGGPRRPVLVTGGTSPMLDRRFYKVALEGIQASGQPGVLVTPHRALLPDPLPTGVRWFPYLPFPALMPQVAAVVHHGGIGTLARALAAGTPQVILAHGSDCPDNGERLARLGLASCLRLSQWTPEEIAAALDGAVRDGAYRQRVAEVRADVSSDRAVHAAAQTIEGVLRSPEPAERLRDRLGGLSVDQRRRMTLRLRQRAALGRDPP